MPQLICLSPQTVSGLVDSLTHFLRLRMFEAAASSWRDVHPQRHLPHCGFRSRLLSKEENVGAATEGGDLRNQRQAHLQ